MKRLLFFLLPVLLLAACNSGIQSRYEVQAGFKIPNLGTIPVMTYDSMYTLAPTFSQKKKIAERDGTIVWAYVFLCSAIILIVYGIVYTVNAGRFMLLGVVSFVLAICMLMASAASINWAITKEVPIKKTTYDSLNRIPGGIDNYVEQNIFQ